MPRETDNLPQGGTDNAHPLSLDDAANLDFDDPLEDTEEAGEDQQSDEETVETDDEGQETDETAADDEEAGDDDGQSDGEDGSEPDDDSESDGEQGQPAEVKDDAIIKMPDGESLTFGEIKSGYMRQADYTRKRQEDSNRRKEVESLATNVNQAVEAIVGHLQKTLPGEPDPQLAITNPNEYTRKKALHDQAMAQIGKVLETAPAPQETVNKLSEQQHRELIASETEQLAAAFPQVRTQEGHKQFFENTASVAKELGYSDEEIGQATDHRLFKLAHYARLGMQAEAAKAKAKDKVKDAPPVAPTKRQKGKTAHKARKNADGMRQLQKSGSIRDAMKIDFD